MTSILLTGAGPTFSGAVATYDTDAQAYITAVEAADGQSLETGVKDAINAFVVGCKSDGIWTAIKASCILAGARTLSGALVPLVGTAPTNNNFVSGDYSRTAGLTGDGVNKYLDSNRTGNADPQDDMHIAAYCTANRDAGNSRYISGTPSISRNSLIGNTTGFRSRNNTSTLVVCGTGTAIPSLLGVSRSSSLSFDWTGFSHSGTAIESSISQETSSLRIFGIVSLFISSTLAFYSIGESLDLADLDTRVTTLITDIGTALA